jgi:hypothetical protein
MTELPRQRVPLEACLRAAPADRMSDDAGIALLAELRHDTTKERL